MIEFILAIGLVLLSLWSYKGFMLIGTVLNQFETRLLKLESKNGTRNR